MSLFFSFLHPTVEPRPRIPTRLHHHLGRCPVDILLEPYAEAVSALKQDTLFLMKGAYPPKTWCVVVSFVKKEIPNHTPREASSTSWNCRRGYLQCVSRMGWPDGGVRSMWFMIYVPIGADVHPPLFAASCRNASPKSGIDYNYHCYTPVNSPAILL